MCPEKSNDVVSSSERIKVENGAKQETTSEKGNQDRPMYRLLDHSSRGEPPRLMDPSRLIDPPRLDPPRLDGWVDQSSSTGSTSNALADVWVRICRCMLHAMLNRRPQPGCVHANGRSPVCVNIWFRNVLCFENLFPQSAQTYFRAGSVGGKRGFGTVGSRSSRVDVR